MKVRVCATVVLDAGDGVMLDLALEKLNSLRIVHDALVDVIYSGEERLGDG